MNIYRNFVAIGMLALLTGCVGSMTPQLPENSNISEFQSAVRQTTNAVDNTAPGFNDMNTCPKGMQRIDHTAGGGGDASVGTSEAGTEFKVGANFGQGHKCVYK